MIEKYSACLFWNNLKLELYPQYFFTTFRSFNPSYHGRGKQIFEVQSHVLLYEILFVCSDGRLVTAYSVRILHCTVA